MLDAGDAQARSVVRPTLQHWQVDPDLAGVRDPGLLAQLPAEEQKEWRALWADVAALLRKARGDRP
jgi:hypothetical protein